MDWIKDGQKTSFLMWLYGPAGAGKSAIAQTIAEMCHRLGILVATFFWSRSAADRNDETRLVASLAYQLVVTIPLVCRPLLCMACTSPNVGVPHHKKSFAKTKGLTRACDHRVT